VGQGFKQTGFSKKLNPMGVLGFIGAGFYWFFCRVLLYEWRLLNVIHIKQIQKWKLYTM